METIMTVQVKKAYVELYQLMLANPKKQIGTLMPEFLELMQSKSAGGSNGKSFIKNAEGVVTHVYCYYHKKWEDVTIAEYGKKTNTASGLNTMCKEGVSAWTKQQRIKKQAEAKLLERVASGDLEVGLIADEQVKILEQSKLIEPRSDEHGTDEL